MSIIIDKPDWPPHIQEAWETTLRATALQRASALEQFIRLARLLDGPWGTVLHAGSRVRYAPNPIARRHEYWKGQQREGVWE